MWLHIRTFGELHILTRASYFLLFFVPILVSIWPTVESQINKYAFAIEEVNLQLKSTTERLEFISLSSLNLDSNETKEIINNLQERIDLINKKYPHEVIYKKSFPITFALGFLASLSVLIGHLLYQSFAPSLIRRSPLHLFVNEKLQKFDNFPSENQVEYAKEYIEYSNTKYIKEKNFSVLPGVIAEKKKEQARRNSLGIIEQGAIGEYLHSASERKVFAIFSGAFYIVGLVILLYILTIQTINVVTTTW